MDADLPLPLSKSQVEQQLLHILQTEAEACASLLAWAQESQRALLTMQPDQITYTSQQQLKALAALHRIELNRKALLIAWADLYGMAFPSVTVMDVAGRMSPADADQLVHLTRSIAQRLEELTLINQCNRLLVRLELELRRALWHRLAGNEPLGTLYGPTGQFSTQPGGGHLLERQV
ncbi:MAG: flagellar export chaperone FlgN [Anaerolineae bacterium]|nr:flagellar export chaperone FlgN [Anaerolineae bacterium]MDW8099680.1 flagellar export chaperone FlgN [Anaerolineae bacterium]